MIEVADRGSRSQRSLNTRDLVCYTHTIVLLLLIVQICRRGDGAINTNLKVVGGNGEGDFLIRGDRADGVLGPLLII